MDCETSSHSTTTTCDSTTNVKTKRKENKPIKTIADATSTSTTTTTTSSDTDVTSGQSEKIDVSTISRVKLKERNFRYYERNELWSKWRKQDDYIDTLEAKIDSSKSDATTIKELEEKLAQQKVEAVRRENDLAMKLAKKEQKVANLINRVQAMREALIPSDSRLESSLLDPTLNLMFDRMKSEVASSRERVDQAQNELAAWKFTADSQTGKQLMAKCQALYKENQELGKTIESGRINKLESELALQKSFVEEMKKSQMETDDFLTELDEEVEGIQSTMLDLRNQLRENRE